MHILAAIGATLGVALFFLWRMQQASNAVRDVADAAGEVHSLFRRWSWRRKANVSPLDLVEDPREAATAMMVIVAQTDGALTGKECAVIQAQISEHFGATSRQADELLARGRWLVQHSVDASEVFRRLAPSIRKSCSAGEREDLIAMLKAVATAEGPLDAHLQNDIANLRQHLKE
jgi:uncharacterized tellurite resistance protein B-like protein